MKVIKASRILMEIGDCEIEQTFEYLNYKVDSLVKLCVWFYVLHIPIYRLMMDIKVKKYKKKNGFMTNKEKLEALKAFLTENGIKFIEDYKSGLHVMMDLKLPDYMIAVHLSDDKDDEFYHRTFRQYKPFFIRESETPEFIIEKMQNCITDIMVKRQKIYEKKQKKEEGRRIAAEYERRHQEKLAAQTAAEKPKRKRVRIPMAERVTPLKK